MGFSFRERGGDSPLMVLFPDVQDIDGAVLEPYDGLRVRACTGGGAKMPKSNSFNNFYGKVQSGLLQHEVIVGNPYTKWWKQGRANTDQFVELVKQFSVFSNYFVPIQAKRMANATTEAAERGARAILGNELGVALDVSSGDIEGGAFSHQSAHINWLREIGEMLGIDRRLLGRWAIGAPATHLFLEHLETVYGSLDPSIGAGASFAVETWAASGIGKGPEAEANNFWKELIVGIEAYNAAHRTPKGLQPIPTGFFQYHFDIERGHASNVASELQETFADQDFREDQWLYGGAQALGALLIFWRGLDEARKGRERLAA